MLGFLIIRKYSKVIYNLDTLLQKVDYSATYGICQKTIETGPILFLI